MLFNESGKCATETMASGCLLASIQQYSDLRYTCRLYDDTLLGTMHQLQGFTIIASGQIAAFTQSISGSTTAQLQKRFCKQHTRSLQAALAEISTTVLAHYKLYLL